MSAIIQGRTKQEKREAEGKEGLKSVRTLIERHDWYEVKDEQETGLRGEKENNKESRKRAGM